MPSSLRDLMLWVSNARSQEADQLSVPDMAALVAIFARRGPPYEMPLFRFLSMAIRQVPPDLIDAQGQ